MADRGREILEEACEELEKEVSDPIARALRWLRAPERRWIRISIALPFIVGGLLWFLPVVGVELLPIGLLLLSQDVPFMRAPMGHAILWMVHRWRGLKSWWRRRARNRRRANAARHP
jgi:hypothetical protein